MRVFHIVGNEATELAAAPRQLPSTGFLWLACSRSYFSEQLESIQSLLQSLAGSPLVDLHVSDLLNAQLPSHYDYTSQYDLLVMRRLAAAPGKAGTEALAAARRSAALQPAEAAPRIDTTPVGFAVWDKVLFSVHPEDCTVRDAYARACCSLPRRTAAPPPAMRPIWGKSPTPRRSAWRARTRPSARPRHRRRPAPMPNSPSACPHRRPI